MEGHTETVRSVGLGAIGITMRLSAVVGSLQVLTAYLDEVSCLAKARSEKRAIEKMIRDLHIAWVLDGMAAQELAVRSGQPGLINAIAKMEPTESKIALTQCRCGFRLPWKECHAGRSIGESLIF